MNGIRITGLILKWAARILGTLLVLLVMAIIIGETFYYPGDGLPNPLKQPTGVQIEFVGMLVLLVGMVAGWKWQGIGGILVLAGNMMFHIIEAKLYINWVFAAFYLTGLLYLSSWLLSRIRSKTNEN